MQSNSAGNVRIRGAFPVLVCSTMETAVKSANWQWFPDPIKEEEVSIDFVSIKTDTRTGGAIERKAGQWE